MEKQIIRKDQQDFCEKKVDKCFDRSKEFRKSKVLFRTKSVTRKILCLVTSFNMFLSVPGSVLQIQAEEQENVEAHTHNENGWSCVKELICEKEEHFQHEDSCYEVIEPQDKGEPPGPETDNDQNGDESNDLIQNPGGETSGEDNSNPDGNDLSDSVEEGKDLSNLSDENNGDNTEESINSEDPHNPSNEPGEVEIADTESTADSTDESAKAELSDASNEDLKTITEENQGNLSDQNENTETEPVSDSSEGMSYNLNPPSSNDSPFMENRDGRGSTDETVSSAGGSSDNSQIALQRKVQIHSVQFDRDIDIDDGLNTVNKDTFETELSYGNEIISLGDDVEDGRELICKKELHTHGEECYEYKCIPPEYFEITIDYKFRNLDGSVSLVTASDKGQFHIGEKYEFKMPDLTDKENRKGYKIDERAFGNGNFYVKEKIEGMEDQWVFYKMIEPESESEDAGEDEDKVLVQSDEPATNVPVDYCFYKVMNEQTKQWDYYIEGIITEAFGSSKHIEVFYDYEDDLQEYEINYIGYDHQGLNPQILFLYTALGQKKSTVSLVKDVNEYLQKTIELIQTIKDEQKKAEEQGTDPEFENPVDELIKRVDLFYGPPADERPVSSKEDDSSEESAKLYFDITEYIESIAKLVGKNSKDELTIEELNERVSIFLKDNYQYDDRNLDADPKLKIPSTKKAIKNLLYKKKDLVTIDFETQVRGSRITFPEWDTSELESHDLRKDVIVNGNRITGPMTADITQITSNIYATSDYYNFIGWVEGTSKITAPIADYTAEKAEAEYKDLVIYRDTSEFDIHNLAPAANVKSLSQYLTNIPENDTKFFAVWEPCIMEYVVQLWFQDASTAYSIGEEGKYGWAVESHSHDFTRYAPIGTKNISFNQFDIDRADESRVVEAANAAADNGKDTFNAVEFIDPDSDEKDKYTSYHDYLSSPFYGYDFWYCAECEKDPANCYSRSNKICNCRVRGPDGNYTSFCNYQPTEVKEDGKNVLNVYYKAQEWQLVMNANSQYSPTDSNYVPDNTVPQAAFWMAQLNYNGSLACLGLHKSSLEALCKQSASQFQVHTMVYGEVISDYITGYTDAIKNSQYILDGTHALYNPKTMTKVADVGLRGAINFGGWTTPNTRIFKSANNEQVVTTGDIFSGSKLTSEVYYDPRELTDESRYQYGTHRMILFPFFSTAMERFVIKEYVESDKTVPDGNTLTGPDGKLYEPYVGDHNKADGSRELYLPFQWTIHEAAPPDGYEPRYWRTSTYNFTQKANELKEGDNGFKGKGVLDAQIIGDIPKYTDRGIQQNFNNWKTDMGLNNYQNWTVNYIGYEKTEFREGGYAYQPTFEVGPSYSTNKLTTYDTSSYWFSNWLTIADPEIDLSNLSEKDKEFIDPDDIVNSRLRLTMTNYRKYLNHENTAISSKAAKFAMIMSDSFPVGYILATYYQFDPEMPGQHPNGAGKLVKNSKSAVHDKAEAVILYARKKFNLTFNAGIKDQSGTPIKVGNKIKVTALHKEEVPLYADLSQYYDAKIWVNAETRQGYLSKPTPAEVARDARVNTTSGTEEEYYERVMRDMKPEWYLDADATIEFNEDNILAIYRKMLADEKAGMPPRDIDIYGFVDNLPFPVKFHLNNPEDKDKNLDKDSDLYVNPILVDPYGKVNSDEVPDPIAPTNPQPVDPNYKPKYKFIKWTYDKDGKQDYKFNKEISEETDLYAQWEEIKETEYVVQHWLEEPVLNGNNGEVKYTRLKPDDIRIKLAGQTPVISPDENPISITDENGETIACYAVESEIRKTLYAVDSDEIKNRQLPDEKQGDNPEYTAAEIDQFKAAANYFVFVFKKVQKGFFVEYLNYNTGERIAYQDYIASSLTVYSHNIYDPLENAACDKKVNDPSTQYDFIGYDFKNVGSLRSKLYSTEQDETIQNYNIIEVVENSRYTDENAPENLDYFYREKQSGEDVGTAATETWAIPERNKNALWDKEKGIYQTTVKPGTAEETPVLRIWYKPHYAYKIQFMDYSKIFDTGVTDKHINTTDYPDLDFYPGTNDSITRIAETLGKNYESYKIVKASVMENFNNNPDGTAVDTYAGSEKMKGNSDSSTNPGWLPNLDDSVTINEKKGANGKEWKYTNLPEWVPEPENGFQVTFTPTQDCTLVQLWYEPVRKYKIEYLDYRDFGESDPAKIKVYATENTARDDSQIDKDVKIASDNDFVEKDPDVIDSTHLFEFLMNVPQFKRSGWGYIGSRHSTVTTAEDGSAKKGWENSEFFRDIQKIDENGNLIYETPDKNWGFDTKESYTVTVKPTKDSVTIQLWYYPILQYKVEYLLYEDFGESDPRTVPLSESSVVSQPVYTYEQFLDICAKNISGYKVIGYTSENGNVLVPPRSEESTYSLLNSRIFDVLNQVATMYASDRDLNEVYDDKQKNLSKLDGQFRELVPTGDKNHEYGRKQSHWQLMDDFKGKDDSELCKEELQSAYTPTVLRFWYDPHREYTVQYMDYSTYSENESENPPERIKVLNPETGMREEVADEIIPETMLEQLDIVAKGFGDDWVLVGSDTLTNISDENGTVTTSRSEFDKLRSAADSKWGSPDGNNWKEVEVDGNKENHYIITILPTNEGITLRFWYDPHRKYVVKCLDIDYYSNPDDPNAVLSEETVDILSTDQIKVKAENLSEKGFRLIGSEILPEGGKGSPPETGDTYSLKSNSGILLDEYTGLLNAAKKQTDSGSNEKMQPFTAGLNTPEFRAGVFYAYYSSTTDGLRRKSQREDFQTNTLDHLDEQFRRLPTKIEEKNGQEDWILDENWIQKTGPKILTIIRKMMIILSGLIQGRTGMKMTM